MKHGGHRPGAGRPAGSQNADTAAMRAALSGLLEGQVAVAITSPLLACATGLFGLRVVLIKMGAHSDTSDQVFRRHMISHSGVSDHPEMPPSGAVW